MFDCLISLTQLTRLISRTSTTIHSPLSADRISSHRNLSPVPKSVPLSSVWVEWKNTDLAEIGCDRSAQLGDVQGWGASDPRHHATTTICRTCHRRYESAMWRASGLVEPQGAVPTRSPGPSGADAEMGADNATAGGMFGWLGRDAGES